MAARLRGGTLFSGICAPEQAMPEIDWRWRAEIDPFANAVAEARHPGVPNLGSVLEIDPDAVEPVDLLVFGSPCQDFSIAGKRAGMDGERGNLTLVALELARRLRPRWLVFENVPGLLSNWSGDAPGDLAEGEEREGDQYSDMAAFLGAVRDGGHLGAYRVLDAQYFGVPQRRRRILFVGHLGDWRPAAAVLFEPESLRGDPPPRREAGEGVARPVAASPAGGSGYRNDADTAENLIAGALQANGKAAGSATQQDAESGLLVAFGGNNTAGPIDVATARNAHGGPPGRLDFESETFIAHSLRAEGFDASEDGTGRGTPLVPVAMNLRGREGGAMPEMDDLASIRAASGGSSRSYLAFDCKAGAETGFAIGDVPGPLRGEGHGGGHAAVTSRSGVRRITPRECERLMGLPDDYTLVTYRGKPAADGPRYRALGNSMAVPVMRWLLGRILTCDNVLRRLGRAA